MDCRGFVDDDDWVAGGLLWERGVGDGGGGGNGFDGE